MLELKAFCLPQTRQPTASTWVPQTEVLRYGTFTITFTFLMKTLTSALVLMTANFKYQSIENMDALLKLQPNRPILVSEFWPGWFDHWLEPLHNTLNLQGTNSFIEYFMTSVFLVVHFHY